MEEGEGGRGKSGHKQNPQTQFLSFNTSGASLEAETNCSNTKILWSKIASKTSSGDRLFHCIPLNKQFILVTMGMELNWN